MVRNFGDGEYSLRSVGIRRGREFGCTYFLNGNAALSQCGEDSLIAAAIAGGGQRERATYGEVRTEQLFDGANTFGDEQAVALTSMTTLEVARYSEETHAARRRREFGIGLALGEPNYGMGKTMRRILASALMAVTAAGCSVSTQQEKDLGAQYSQQINSQLPIVQDPEVNRYINVLGDSIAQLTARGGELDWKFYVVNSSEVNAFAVPGGYIYVNRGLIDRAKNLSELAGVLGHEIGHVVKRHSIKQMQQQQGAQVGVTLGCVLLNVCGTGIAQAGINVAGSAIFAKFSRDDETQADEVGIENVVRAGISPKGIPEMFQILLDERQSNPGAVELWFGTHPTEEGRIADTQAIINKIDPAILRSLTYDSPRFHDFKQRVQSLPAPPPQRKQ
jgi:Zn-dependent protease with chaperone function